MDFAQLSKLRDPIVDEFQSNAALNDWVAINVGMPVDDILKGSLLSERVTSFLLWMHGEDQTLKVLKALADQPPNGSRKLPALIYKLTGGTVRPAESIANGIPPVEPHRTWFVGGRPFVNRDGLRMALATLDNATDDANSVLVIEGGTRTGKTHGIRLAAYCAPRARFNGFDLAEWGADEITVTTLAQAIVPKGTGLPPVDPTKEAAAVMPTFSWIKGQLMGTRQWIIIDHCNRTNLSSAAESLLFLLASHIEKGFLPGVRLVLADVQRARLPESLKTDSRYDRADLPDRKAVRTWCRTLAAHVGKPLDDAAVEQHVTSVLGAETPNPQPLSIAEFETRLRAVLVDIQASGGGGN